LELPSDVESAIVTAFFARPSVRVGAAADGRIGANNERDVLAVQDRQRCKPSGSDVVTPIR
jgi:hypothetical protein